MVFKILSCSGVFTRVHLHTTLPQWAAAKIDIALSLCPTHFKGLPKSLPPPHHLSVPDPAWRWMFFVIPWPILPHS